MKEHFGDQTLDKTVFSTDYIAVEGDFNKIIFFIKVPRKAKSGMKRWIFFQKLYPQSRKPTSEGALHLRCWQCRQHCSGQLRRCLHINWDN
jgi:hypothetical protein